MNKEMPLIQRLYHHVDTTDSHINSDGEQIDIIYPAINIDQEINQEFDFDE